MIRVNNMPADVCNGEWKYVIVRDCCDSTVSPGYWYYGADNNLRTASTVAREIGNGFVLPYEEVEVGECCGY